MNEGKGNGSDRSVMDASRLIQAYLRGEISKEDETPDAAAYAENPATAWEVKTLSHQQLRMHRSAMTRVEQALRVRQAENETDWERAQHQAEEHGSMLFCTGPPGTGKTLVADRIIRDSLALGARVAYFLPTGALACRMRVRYPDLWIDTCHGGLCLNRPRAEGLYILEDIDILLIDEAPTLLEEHFDRVQEMWTATGKTTCVCLFGDEWQLPPPTRDARSLVMHSDFRRVTRIHLHEVRRQGADDPLLSILQYLRVNRPQGSEGKAFIRKLCRGRKAWSNHHNPTTYDLDCLYRDHPDTHIITCTRRGAAVVNRLSVTVLFTNRNKPRLGVIPGDWEFNLENYDENTNQVKAEGDLVPETILLYKGLRVTLTKNQHKENHYVNGMQAIVEDLMEWGGRSRGIIVRTCTDKRLAIYPVTEWGDEKGVPRKVTHYPLRVGYAATVHKYIGAELEHVTFWPDRAGAQAAGYTALSRVRSVKDFLLGGIVRCEHFVPAEPGQR